MLFARFLEKPEQGVAITPLVIGHERFERDLLFFLWVDLHDHHAILRDIVSVLIEQHERI